MSLHQPRRLLRLFVALLAGVEVLLYGMDAEAAEVVVLKYRFLRESISVPELTTFAQTGEASSSLRSYLKMSNKEPDELRETLTKAVEVNPILLYRLLRTQPGEMLLNQLSEIIHTPNNRANQQSLRSAIVSSALADGDVTLIEILENYPTEYVEVEGDRLAEFSQRVDNFAQRLPKIKL